ncbi:MAG: hypothetical protein FWH55_02755 [Oscillospiraceae bacterium]|nr:hypothetical protein [Oscillospiraceae bacterium]
MEPYYNDVMIQEVYKSMQVNPSDGLKTRVIESAAAGAYVQRPAKRRKCFIALPIAATVAMIMLTTIIVYGSEIITAIKELHFGNLTVYQFEQPEIAPEIAPEISEDTSEIAGEFKIRDCNYCYPHYGFYAGMSVFYSMDELQQTAAFEVKAPAYIPQNAEFSQAVGLRFYKDEQISTDGKISANNQISADDQISAEEQVAVDDQISSDDHVLTDDQISANEQILVADIRYNVHTENGEGYLFLTQLCAKSEPTSSIKIAHGTTDPIDQVMIGDIEAAAIFTDNGEMKRISLQWLAGDTQYELISGAYDLDTMIAIAESIK